uniref:Uncharacterized protein n=1 Tax=viral metagenome TaxID=1070528 RepID=A0A6M3LZJ1_9ZZZZ
MIYIISSILLITALYFSYMNMRVNHFRKTCKPGDPVKFWINQTAYRGEIQERHGDDLKIVSFLTGNEVHDRKVNDITMPLI